jgi:hypothetical protein
MRTAYKILVGRPERKRLLRIPSLRWEYNVRMDLREIGWELVDWMDLTQDRNQWRAPLNTELVS